MPSALRERIKVNRAKLLAQLARESNDSRLPVELPASILLIL
jgi:hypothetical protein